MTASSLSEEKRCSRSWRDIVLHHAAVWGVVLCALTPMRHDWIFHAGEMTIPGRIWAGHFLIDAVELIMLTLLGLAAGGWWWWAAGWRRGRAGAGGALVLAVMGSAAITGRFPPFVLGGMLAIWFLWAVVAACFFPRRREQSIAAFFRDRRSWNAVFFLFFVAVNTAGDVMMTGSAPPGWLATAGFVTGRFFTHLVVASCLWLLLTLCARWSPPGSSWLGWGAVMFVPLLVAVDAGLRMVWTKGLMNLCAEIESGGKVEVAKLMEGGGIQPTASHLVIIAGCLLSVPVWFLLCGRLSRLGGWRASPARFGGIALAAWLCLMALEAAEAAGKSNAWRHWESRACMMHLTPFSAPHGLVTFRVVPADPVLAGPLSVTRKPDIYFFIVETLRADALQPERTPFLWRWKNEECQLIGESRSAANSTHLSWFSILHGRLPWHWEKVRRQVGTAPILALLQDAGYRVEVRGAGNFDYNEMLTGNFGQGETISVLEHVPLGHPDRVHDVTEREVRMMARLRASVTDSAPGSALRLTSIDSAHYPYWWHEKWTPPYPDYERTPMFPLRPSPAEIESVRNRYWNSISWGDHLVAEFITFLKESGRYDQSMVILTGDHGEEFKEHGSWFHCSALNPEQTRVPVLIKWPAGMGRGPVLGDASHLDIVPSILDAAGCSGAVWSGMPGRSLYRGGSATSIMTTNFNSQNGEAMVWRRDGWEAAFSWPLPYTAAPPHRVWLERLEGPDGPVECPNPAAYEVELRRHFPDAFARVFSSCERSGD